MRLTIAVLALAFAGTAFGQTTTDTNCQANGSNINCTSTSNTNTVPPVDTQRGYEAGQALGAGIGNAIYALRVRKAIQNQDKIRVTYCQQNPNGSISFSGQTESCSAFMAQAKASCTVKPKYPACKLMKP